ncbi:MAG: 50S ribosomal protein L32 [Candidatus Moraniibacteriota bacterium]|nr:MAG: 50S ribosomal protein L32 [Candidatus Moranbacteria bacterium]
MSVPKQRHSNRRQARGRTRYVKKPKNLSVCPSCSSPMLLHRACPVCHTYRGRKYGSSSKESVPPKKKRAESVQ